MKVLIVGNGGREHAIAWKVRKSPLVKKVYCAPGNAGISSVAENVSIPVENIEELASFAKSQSIDLTIVGPEYPLSLGIVDKFESEGLKVFGPTKAAARLESSKGFAKEIMKAAGVPTASSEIYYDAQTLNSKLRDAKYPLVLKADGLAAGKGVVVCQTKEEALQSVEQLFSYSADTGKSSVLVEEFLSGVEASFIVATDGRRVVPFSPSHDYKRIFDGDMGPNTGGMGTVCPTPRFSPERTGEVLERIIYPMLKEMEKRGTPFKGFLYAGLMLGFDGSINVIEFNARFGDPECQVILRTLDSDLIEIILSLLESGKEVPTMKSTTSNAICVVLASEGYPSSPRKGDEIVGLNLAEALPNVEIFHAGTKKDDQGRIITNGGRVLNVTATGESLEDARRLVYRACDMIQFKGRQIRRDIGKAV